ncbi:facilitated trehalose transporter Tret1-2 homolog [Periplaneta americana]|uniref:facilitated trehalose transporter Tret1-2 homolog n=1 Tax=Periplaneta americana TaxID=6978 RepID=UPI0037E80EE3
MTTEEASGTNRPEEGVPMLINGSTAAKIATTANGQTLENSDTRKEDYQSENVHSSPKGVIAQSLVAGAVFLLTTCCGIHVGYSAILLPQLKASNSTLPTDEELGSWIASVQSIASPFGAFLSGLLMDRWGRRTTLILCTLPFTASWLLLAFATKHAVILAARAMAGFASGLTVGPTQVLVGEISEPRIRGILTGTNFLSHSIGILLVYVMGSVMDWDVVSGVSTIFPLLSLVAFILLPESPVWLVRHNKIAEAEKALRWLRGGGVGIQAKRELEQLVLRYQSEKEEALKRSTEDAGNNCCNNLSKPHILKPFVIVSMFYLIQVTSGTYLVIFYAVDIITQAGSREGLGLDRFFAAVLTAVVRLVFTIIMCFLLLWTGRRPLALVAGFLQALSAISLGAFLYLKNGISITDYEFPACKYLIIGSMLAYVAFNTCGYFSMPGIAMGELLPAKIRGSVGGYILAGTYLGFFVTTKIFPWLCNVLGVHGVFTAFGAIAFVGSFFMYLFLPESSGKSLTEIENYFRQPNVLWVGRNRVLRRRGFVPETYEMQVRC